MTNKKIESLTSLIRQNIQSVGDVTGKAPEFKHEEKDLEKTKLAIARSVKKLSMRNASFGYSRLTKQINDDDETEQSTNNLTDLIKTSISNFDTEETGELIYVGPKEFDIVTTRKQIEEELEIISLIAAGNEKANLSAPIDLIKKVDLIKKAIAKKEGFADEQRDAVYACTKPNSIISAVEGYAYCQATC